MDESLIKTYDFITKDELEIKVKEVVKDELHKYDNIICCSIFMIPILIVGIHLLIKKN